MRQTGDVSASDDPCHCGPAAVRERRDGLLYIREIGVAPENPIVDSDPSIQTEVKLVLMFAVIRGSAVVVCRGCEIGWNREAAQECLGHRVERNANHIVRKLLPNGSS